MRSYRGTEARQRAPRGHNAARGGFAKTHDESRAAKAAHVAEAPPARDDDTTARPAG